MIDIKSIMDFYPPLLQKHKRFILKEYMQYKILDIIFRSKYASRLSFLGGTCLRIVHSNQRFSEDLDFDNFDLTEKEFGEISKTIKTSLQKEGYKVEIKQVIKSAFHCYIKFPDILFQAQLSGHTKEKIFISLDTFAHDFSFSPTTSIINKFDVFTPIITTPPDIIFSQKVFAILNRKRNKGRDFFDLSFLMAKGIKPNYDYLKKKVNLNNHREVKDALITRCYQIDMEEQANDVEPFLFDFRGSDRVRLFAQYIQHWAG